MAQWSFTFTVERARGLPVYVQLARAIMGDIRRGRIRPGAYLPGSRTLAAELDLHRNTVLAAYRELTAEGWLETSRARGTFVSRAMPTPDTRPGGSGSDRVGYAVPPRHARAFPQILERSKGTMFVDGGVPDLRLAPLKTYLRAYRRAVLARGGQVLHYHPLPQEPRLASALGEMLGKTRGVDANAGRLLVTHGATAALHLIASTLVREGDLWAVENPGYFYATQALLRAGARVVPVEIDGEGLRVDLLEPLIRRGLKGLFTTPQHQYPTMVGLSAARRVALLELARRHQLAIIEDDFDHEFHYENRPTLPLASEDPGGNVLYVGSMSKVFAPGVRLGYVCGPPPIIERLAHQQRSAGLEADWATMQAMAELIEEGELARHFYRMRRVYLARRDAQVDELRRALGKALNFDVPRGGMATWARVDPGIDVDAWLERAQQRGVFFQTGQRYFFNQKTLPFVRLGFSSMTPPEMREAIRRMAASLPARR